MGSYNLNYYKIENSPNTNLNLTWTSCFFFQIYPTMVRMYGCPHYFMLCITLSWELVEILIRSIPCLTANTSHR